MILVCGNFGKGTQTSSGQIIRTTSVYETLVDVYGQNFVQKYNTSNGVLSLIRLVVLLPHYLFKCKSVIIFPAENGVRIIVPLLKFFNLFFHRDIHYVAIGGWLPDFLSNKPLLMKRLKSLSGIYVQTSNMLDRLNGMGFDNVHILSNFKKLPLLNENELRFEFDACYGLCTFSRVIKEKGIEDAINAVKDLNNKYGKHLFYLDIYGNVDENQRDWFEAIKSKFPEFVSYKGGVKYNESVNVLKGYYALLFPTYYEGEGFAGTLIDAMAAGLPVISSDWKYNPEFVRNNSTGLLFHTHDVKDLEEKIDYLYLNPEEYKRMRIESLMESRKYMPKQAIKVLSDRLNATKTAK